MLLLQDFCGVLTWSFLQFVGVLGDSHRVLWLHLHLPQLDQSQGPVFKVVSNINTIWTAQV